MEDRRCKLGLQGRRELVTLIENRVRRSGRLRLRWAWRLRRRIGGGGDGKRQETRNGARWLLAYVARAIPRRARGR